MHERVCSKTSRGYKERALVGIRRMATSSPQKAPGHLKLWQRRMLTDRTMLVFLTRIYSLLSEAKIDILNTLYSLLILMLDIARH
jgi:hypothetical protein